jgi:tRNA threonylcarbamoyladenosine biosynthesis protein TsaE
MGELGSGKTVFAKGLAEALHIADAPASPTFALVQVHRPKHGRVCLRHVDLYRLGPAEVPALEWEELHDEEGVTVVEWAEKCRFLWPPQVLPVRLSHLGRDARRIDFLPAGSRALALIRRLRKPA